MSEMTDELLRRIAERAADPRRRYMTAADDEALVSLPVEDIEKCLDAAVDLSGDMFRDMLARLRESGFPTPTMSFDGRDGRMRATTDAPGAKRLKAPPAEDDWRALEAIATGRSRMICESCTPSPMAASGPASRGCTMSS